MSDAIGPIAVVPLDGQYVPGAQETAERTHELIDTEVRKLVDEAHEEATELLRQNRDKLDSLAHALLEKETLDEVEAYAAAGMAPPPRTEEEKARPAQAPAPA
jgi:cell division protease FtsH